MEAGDLMFHDHFLEPAWYKSPGLDMPMEAVPFLSCGTQFPIWMNGQLPTPGTGVDNAIACRPGITGDCDFQYNIQVINCGEFNAYHLVQTETDTEGYCFGVGEPGAKPSFRPDKPIVIPKQNIRDNGVDPILITVHFRCSFIISTIIGDEDLFYRVTWYAEKDGVVNSLTTHRYHKDDIDKLELTEEQFIGELGMTLGVEMWCTAQPFSSENGAPGITSDLSERFFAGAKVTVDTPVIERGPSGGTLSVEPTIPIGCFGVPECRMTVNTYIPGTCGGIGTKDKCGISIESHKWNQKHSLNILAIDTEDYDIQGLYVISLETRNIINSNIWKHYKIGTYQIQIVDKLAKTWEGRKCHSVNDPHMYTFDRRHFEMHEANTYVLYRHSTYKTEVQIKTKLCSSYRNVMCNCGVAVRAGLEVYVIDRCDPTRAPYAQYKDGCTENTLSIKKLGTYEYDIILPYNTKVSVRGGRLFNVYVYSSALDQGDATIQGLCGSLNGQCSDDFKKRDGVVFAENTNCKRDTPSEFFRDWRVKLNEDLFKYEAVKDTLEPWPIYVCICKSDQEHQLEEQVKCYGDTANAKCTKGKIVGKKTCEIKKRRRRDIPDMDRHPRRKQNRNARSVPRLTVQETEPQTNWTEANATQFCVDYISQSPIFQQCQDVPSANVESALDSCMMDILITGTTDWAENARDSMRTLCVGELDRNNTLRMSTNGTPSIAEAIYSQACPGMCSQQGTCLNGTCDCAHGFGGSDCSVDLLSPPDVFGLIDEGKCDEKFHPCTDAVVFGEPFIESSNLTCKLRRFQMSLSGDKLYNDERLVAGEHETVYEMYCPVDETTKVRKSLKAAAESSFVHGYSIAVSNDGEHFTEEYHMYMYDSTCQQEQTQGDTITFSLVEGTCFLDSACVLTGQLHVENSCLRCDPTLSTTTWSEITNTPGCRSDDVTTPPEDSIDTTTTVKGGSGSDKNTATINMLMAAIAAVGLFQAIL